MQGNNVTIGGRTGNFFFVDWFVQSQNPAANQSTIRWDAYFYYDQADAQLDDVDVTVGGVLVLDNPGRVKNFQSNFTARSHYITGGTVTLNHDNNGNLSVAVSGSIGGSLSARSSGSAGAIAISGFDRTPTTPSIGTPSRDSSGTVVSATASGGVNNSGPGVTWVLQISTDNVNFSDTSSATTSSGSTLAVGGLSKTTNYFFRIRASNSVNTKFSGSLGSSGFPSAPTGLTATPSSTVSGRIDLSWSAPGTTNGGITGYTIFRNGSVLTNTSGTGTTFANTGLTPGTVYSYYVVARNSSADSAGGSSDASNTVSNITVPGVPGAPTGLTATPGTNSTDTGKIYLSWTAPTFQNPSITGYDIFRNGTRITPVLNGTATTFVDTGLTPGTLYAYRVQARNAFADSSGLRSPDSNTTASVIAPGVPSIPRNFTATPDGTSAGRINLAWQEPTSTNGTITGYDIFRKLSTDANYSSTPTTVINGNTTLSQTYSGLIEGVTYNFRIVARNSYADSSGLRSAEATATALAPGLPNAPTNLSITGSPTIAGRVSLTWTAPSEPKGSITGYNVFIKLSSDSSFPSTPALTTTGTSTSLTIDGQSGLPGVPVLVVGTSYDFRLSARNAYADSSGGQSPFSNTFAILSPGLPGAPVLTAATASTSAFGRVTLTWDKPSNVGGGIIDYYLYANGLLQTSVAGEDTLTGTITGLTPRQQYAFTVAARNIYSVLNGTPGPQSNGIQQIAPGPPSPPRSLTGTVSELQAGSVTLSWLAPTDVAGGITGYSIYFSDGTLIADTFNTVTSYTVTGLTPAVQYSFYVRARNALSDLPGLEDSSPSNTFTTTARGEPNAPTNFAVVATSAVAGRLTLSWTPPVDSGIIVGYNIFLSNGTKLGSTGTTTFVVDNLIGGQSYSFFVRARNTVTDAAGTEGGTASVSVSGVPGSTSLQTLPAAVTVLNETNTTLSGTSTVTSITSASFSYSKPSSNIPQSEVPTGSGQVVNNTNTTINGTYTAASTPDVSRVTYSRVGPNFSSTAVPNGSITNETNIIFNGTYDTSDINELTRTISYEKVNADISSRAVPTSPQATLSNTTSTIYNADNVSITDVTENTVSYPKVAANIDESPATGVILNNTNREIYNGTYTITNVSSYNKFSYSTGDDVTQTNLAKNPSMERVGSGTDILRTNHYANPRMSNSTAGWTLLAPGATQTPDVNGTVIDFSDDVAPTSAFFYETTAIPIAVGEYSVASIELTVPPTFPELTLTSILRSYGAGDAATQTVTIKPGQTVRFTSGVFLTASASTGVRNLIGTANTISAGSRLVVRNAIFEKTDTPGIYFDGSSSDALGWAYEWVGTENASKSVAKAQAVVVRKNEITNPGFETSVAGELVRTNFFTNPSFEAVLTGWTATTGMTTTRSTDEFRLGGASLRCVSTATNSEALSPVISVDAGASYTASSFIKGTAGNNVIITIYEYNSSNTEVGSTSSNSIALTGSWQRINITRNLTSLASTIKVAVSDVKPSNAGQTFFLDDTLLEKNAFLDDYFDGNTPDADARAYAWSGTAHASTSTVVTSEVYATNLHVNPSMESVAEGTDVLRINLVDNPKPIDGLGLDWAVTEAGVSGVYTQEYVSAGFRATTTTQNNDSTFTITIGNIDGTTNRIPVLPGIPYAFSVTATSSITDARSVGINWHRADGSIISSTLSTRSALTANVATRLGVAGLAPTGAVTASLIAAKNGVGGPDAALRTLGSTFTVKEALFEQTDQILEYFDGNTTSAKGWLYEWTDNENESTSVAKAMLVTTRTNLLTNPSFETSSVGDSVATNYVPNPSMEGTSGTATIRENLATNPAMEGTSGTSNVRENFATNPGMEATGSAITFRENMATNPSFEDATGTVETPIGTKPGVTGVEAATTSAIAWQESSSALYGTNGIAVEWLKYYGVSSDSGTGLYPFSTGTTPYDLTDTFIDGVYDLHPDNSLTPVSGEDGLYTIGF
jgi:titin